jgi:acetyl-CoA hydrolase
MTKITERIENDTVLAKVVPVEEAVRLVSPRATLAVSGFTKAGDPKTFMPALASYLAAEAPDSRLTLLSGASLSDEVESPLAPFIAKRGPYMSSEASRRLIHAGTMDFSDVHLSQFAKNLAYGFYGHVDLAVVEASRVLEDGSVVLTSSVGLSAEALARAEAVVLEINTAVPDYSGYHDVLLPTVPPGPRWPLPLVGVGDRIGRPSVSFPLAKLAAVVESTVPDWPVLFRPVEELDRRIAENVLDFLLYCRGWLGWGERLPPIQSGVGNVANAIVGQLYESPFERVRFWTEVFQDGMLRFIEDDDKFEAASATALSFSAGGRAHFERLFARCRERIVLRPMWLSNSPELITRLFVIALNTPVEVDIYGHVNSTHVDGSRMVNGLGGSGDFLRNAYLSIVHSPSVRRLKDGRMVSCIMPYVRHIDHTEHDVRCLITEQGVAGNTDIRSPRRRAEDIIEKCAHPHFRPLLRDYLKVAGGGDEPRATDLRYLEGWWSEYDAATRSFPTRV